MNDDSEHESLRSYLRDEDEREKANRQAEAAKQHIKRKCALVYGDSGSHVYAVSFIRPTCSGCDDAIDEFNRSPVMGKCVVCLQESIALRIWQQAEDQRKQQAAIDKKARKSFTYGLSMIGIFVVAMARTVLLGLGVAWLVNALMWALGGGL